MTPRTLIFAGLAAVLVQACGGPSVRAGNGRPNVVVILTDDQRWDMMSCAGHPYLKTPWMDRVAAEGVRFANMFVTTSLCSPSRASFLSGLYAHNHGVVNNFTDYPVDLPSYPRRLQEAGYETAYIGKWHMGEGSDGKRPGFDHWISHKGQGKYYDTTFNIDGTRAPIKGYYTHVVTDFAVQWINRKRTKPFLLVLGHKAPHSPNTPEKKYEKLYAEQEITYPKSAFSLGDKPKWIHQRLDTWHGIYGPLWGYRKKFPDRKPAAVRHFAEFVRDYVVTIRSVDDSLGKIYEALLKSGQLDNTMLLLAGDNGFFLGEHGMMDKRTMHAASIRVPLIVRFPPLIRKPRVIEDQVLNIDLAPTLVEVCGARPLRNIDGRSWAQLLRGDSKGWRKGWYYEYNYEKQFPYTPNVRGIRTDEWKYIRYPHGDGSRDRHSAELYRIKDDPYETKNVINDPQYAGKVKELRSRLERLMVDARAVPDKMPIDQGIKTELPDAKIR